MKSIQCNMGRSKTIDINIKKMLERLHKRWRPQRLQRRWRFMFEKLDPRVVTSVIKRKYPDVNTKQVKRELNRILKQVKKFHLRPRAPSNI